LHYHRHITRKAELTSLAEFHSFIEAACEHRPDIPDHVIYDLQLAVDEACTNIILHGYAGLPPGTITLALELFPQRIVVTITDSGHPFEPKEPPAPDLAASLEERPVGGLGLLFIYKRMDEVHYEATADGNRMMLVKRL